jgi:hypothetical protein
MNTSGLNARLEKLEAKSEPKKQQWVFVESKEDLEEKRKQEEPGQEYVYFHWDWGDEEIEI